MILDMQTGSPRLTIIPIHVFSFGNFPIFRISCDWAWTRSSKAFAGKESPTFGETLSACEKVSPWSPRYEFAHIWKIELVPASSTLCDGESFLHVDLLFTYEFSSHGTQLCDTPSKSIAHSNKILLCLFCYPYLNQCPCIFPSQSETKPPPWDILWFFWPFSHLGSSRRSRRRTRRQLRQVSLLWHEARLTWGCTHTEGCHPSLLCALHCSKILCVDFPTSGFGTLFWWKCGRQLKSI